MVKRGRGRPRNPNYRPAYPTLHVQVDRDTFESVYRQADERNVTVSSILRDALAIGLSPSESPDAVGAARGSTQSDAADECDEV